jgi:hypothetical protein
MLKGKRLRMWKANNVVVGFVMWVFLCALCAGCSDEGESLVGANVENEPGEESITTGFEGGDLPDPFTEGVSEEGDESSSDELPGEETTIGDEGVEPGETGEETGGEGIADPETTPEPETLPEDFPEGSKLIALPDSHSFSYVSPLDGFMMKQVTFQNVGVAPLSIASIGFVGGSSSDFFMVALPPLPKLLQPGDVAYVNVRFMEVEGGEGTLRVESSADENGVLDVLFTSHIKAFIDTPEPCISLNPSQLNFGQVVRGEELVLSTMVQNCSTSQDLTLTQISRSSSFFMPLTEEFQIVAEPNMPVALAPGQSMPIDVSYAPKLAGPDSGYFSFHNSDPSEPQAQLDVSGYGVEPLPEDVGLTIKVSWDEDLCDVDSHLIVPGGTFFDCDTDCHFGNPSPDWGVQGDWIDDPFLDVDDVDGYGPEHINVSEPQPGTYRFVIHYYKDSYDDGWDGAGSSVGTNTTVEVLSYGQVVATFGPEFLDQTNRNWDVFDLEWISPSVTPVVTTLGNTYMISNSQVNSCFSFF